MNEYWRLLTPQDGVRTTNDSYRREVINHLARNMNNKGLAETRRDDQPLSSEYESRMIPRD